jgi:hypothetical protein
MGLATVQRIVCATAVESGRRPSTTTAQRSTSRLGIRVDPLTVTALRARRQAPAGARRGSPSSRASTRASIPIPPRPTRSRTRKKIVHESDVMSSQYGTPFWPSSAIRALESASPRDHQRSALGYSETRDGTDSVDSRPIRFRHYGGRAEVDSGALTSARAHRISESQCLRSSRRVRSTSSSRSSSNLSPAPACSIVAASVRREAAPFRHREKPFGGRTSTTLHPVNAHAAQ